MCLPELWGEALEVLFKTSMTTNTYFTLSLCPDEVPHLLAAVKMLSGHVFLQYGHTWDGQSNIMGVCQ